MSDVFLTPLGPPCAVDDLEEIGELDAYVRRTCCMLLFLSKGYFQSKNCLKEIRATVEKKKPWVLVHEADISHGGLTLEESRDECPPDLREVVFTECAYDYIDGKLIIKPLDEMSLAGSLESLGQAKPRMVITHYRVKDFQLLSLRLICKEVLRQTPYYRNIAHDEKKLSSGSLSRSLSRWTQSASSKSGSFDELEGMFVPGEALQQNYSFEHGCKLIYSPHNPGAFKFCQEMARSSFGVEVVREDVSGLHSGLEDETTASSRPSGRLSFAGIRRLKDLSDARSADARRGHASVTRAPGGSSSPKVAFRAIMLGSRRRKRSRRGAISASSTTRSISHDNDIVVLVLYLNRNTWTGDDGHKLAEAVRAAWAEEVEIIMVHENDPTRNGCEFGHFFQTTPAELIDDGIYKTIATALHPMPHREVSLALVEKACGAGGGAAEGAVARGQGRRAAGGQRRADPGGV